MTRYHAKYLNGEKVYEVVDDVVTINKMDTSREAGYFVMKDIDPYKSMVTGEVITSRSQHREMLKKHNLVEFGNDMPKPKQVGEVSGRREAIIEACKKHGVRGF